ncbi:hypothetical protein LTR78_010720 [Recurvomyces mirabilis]|uniref:Uncharacterized protein n=1 Tax=Recurvomyces mirabilis TaxID=574656 RepID=A0AAE0WHV3_9PEZI|nr:hypothetical protein LTR78_010720 [Recurvomyces mirabilis]KAK5159595.1 hypothetical protein LTS14_002737 [Recurvomyces mirabilis]
MRQVGSVLWPKLRVLQVYGANTGIGKTIFSSILCRAFRRRFKKVHYLKPVSTGPQEEADDRAQPCSDRDIQAAVYDELRSYSTGEDSVAIVETAGGVLSPAPSGNSQADLYRPLRLPVFLVGDHQLGGIGTTISAWESLHIRGYDVQSVALFSEGRYDNHSYLKEYFADRHVHAFSIPPPPERRPDASDDARAMQQYYEASESLQDVTAFTNTFIDAHDKRISNIQSMPAEAVEAIWHPFMQHSERSANTITAIDSAYGDYFQTHTTQQNPSTTSEPAVLKPAFDASASWWTQGLGHGNPDLALTAAHAAGRYGHVMFASAVHEPALRLAQTLLISMGNARLSKVFYTDNGSAGMEVAVKMGIRAAATRYGWDAQKDDIKILGLKNSYHGDTIGTMDASEPSIYNKKEPWYTGRGHWMDFPTVKMSKGEWIIEPVIADEGEVKTFESLDAVFDISSRQTDAKAYRTHLDHDLAELHQKGVKFGALILEPIILGAGGMLFADPLYQRCLVEAARAYDHNPSSNNDPLAWTGMPVVFDEIFTGLYRLGRFSAASFLDVQPDIVANAKLLTGGVLPLCTTTASQSIFEAFLSNDKTDALLHGHSYTAHPIGCSVANKSLEVMAKLQDSADWKGFKGQWQGNEQLSTSAKSKQDEGVWSMWSEAFVKAVSHRSQVDSVFAIGSVLAISLKDADGQGYASKAAWSLRDKLLAGSPGEDWVVHSRVLGNVWYAMGAMTTSRETIQALEERIYNAIE